MSYGPVWQMHESRKEGQGLGLECRAGGCSMHARQVAVRAEDGGIGRIRIGRQRCAPCRILLPSIAAIEARAPAAIPQPGTLPASRSLDVMRPETSSVLPRRRRPGRPHCCVCALLRCSP